MYEGPVIDAHTHPLLYPEGQIGEPHPPEDYIRRAKGSPVTQAAALVIAPRWDMAQTRRRNDATLQLADESEGFYFPVCSVHPSDGAEALAEIERVAAAGSQWLKLHPNNQRFDVADSAVAEVVRRATTAGMPVLFDAYAPWDADQPGKFVRLVQAVPEARLILAHAHGPSFPQLLVYDLLAPYPWWRRQVWVDISATASLLAGARLRSSSSGYCASSASTGSSTGATTPSATRSRTWRQPRASASATPSWRRSCTTTPPPCSANPVPPALPALSRVPTSRA